MNEAEKAAARAVQNENLTAALAEPADLLILDEAGSAWELDMVDKDLLRRAVLERPADVYKRQISAAARSPDTKNSFVRTAAHKIGRAHV